MQPVMAKQRILRKQKVGIKSDTRDGTVVTDWDISSQSISAAVFLVLLCLYSYTTYRSIPGGDSGELVSAACEFGVAHPPGYPLWTLISAAVIRLSPLSAAYSVNLLTCLLAACTGALLQTTCYRLSGSITGSLISTLVFSLSPITWTWSITGEVFALNNLFTVLIIYTQLEFESAESTLTRNRVVRKGAFICGLAATNQHTILLILPAVGIRVLYKLYKHKELSVYVILSILSCGLAGLIPYWYIVISSHINTARWSWGDQTTLQGFLTHLLRVEYGSFNLGNIQDGVHPGFIANLVEYKQKLLREFTLPVYGLACVGIVQTFIDSEEPIRRVLQTGIVMLISYVSFFCWRANLDIASALMREVVERFWIQPNIIWSLLVAMGYKLIYLRLQMKRLMNPVSVSSLVALTAALSVGRSWSHVNHHHDKIVGDFAHSMISSLPNNSLILTKGDLPSATLRYKQYCEGLRPDITLIEQELMSYEWFIPKLRHLFPHVTFPGDRWYNRAGQTKEGIRTFTMLNFLRANIDKRRIFVCIGMQDKENSWLSEFTLMPYGACHQVISRAEDWIEYKHPYIDTWSSSYKQKRNGSWEGVADEEMWSAKIYKALFLYNAAVKQTEKSAKYLLFSQSYKAYKKVMDTHSPVPDYYHKNYALACEKMARNSDLSPHESGLYLREAVKHFQLYVESGSDDPQMSSIRNAIASLRNQL